MKTLTLNRYGNEHPMTFEINHYLQNGNLYVGLVTHKEGYPQPYGSLTVNLGVKCKANCAFIDINNNGNDIIPWLVKSEICKLTGRIQSSGFCIYPEVEFDVKKLSEYM